MFPSYDSVPSGNKSAVPHMSDFALSNCKFDARAREPLSEGYDGSKKISVKQLTKADFLPLSYTPTSTEGSKG